MKRALIFSVMIAMMVLSSCSTVNNAVSSNEGAKSMGSTCAMALTKLYKSYKANGNKIDLNDATTFSNVIAISTSTASLRTNGKDPNYRKAYIAGLVAGSSGLLTNEKAAKVYDKLLSSASAISSVNTSSTASTLTTASTAIVAILSLF